MKLMMVFVLLAISMVSCQEPVTQNRDIDPTAPSNKDVREKSILVKKLIDSGSYRDAIELITKSILQGIPINEYDHCFQQIKEAMASEKWDETITEEDLKKQEMDLKELKQTWGKLRKDWEKEEKKALDTLDVRDNESRDEVIGKIQTMENELQQLSEVIAKTKRERQQLERQRARYERELKYYDHQLKVSHPGEKEELEKKRDVARLLFNNVEKRLVASKNISTLEEERESILNDYHSFLTEHDARPDFELKVTLLEVREDHLALFIDYLYGRLKFSMKVESTTSQYATANINKIYEQFLGIRNPIGRMMIPGEVSI